MPAAIGTIIDAIDYARRRKVVLPKEYYAERVGEARAAAFSIAGLARVEQLEMVLESLASAMEEGISYRKWAKRVTEAGVSFPRHRLDNIYRTNLQGSYVRGRCAAQRALKAIRPYLYYSAVNDSRTRPSHAAMHGTILPQDDRWWKTHLPPNGFRCRCTAIAITEDEARRRGITQVPPVGADPDDGWDYNVCADGIEEGLRRAVARKDESTIARTAIKDGSLEYDQAPFLRGREATLDAIKRLGGERLDDLMQMRLPEDRELVPLMSARGKTVGELIENGLYELVVPGIKAVLYEDLRRRRTFGTVQPEIYQKRGKGRAAILRAASKYPDDWVENANRYPLHVVFSQARGYFSVREWIRGAREYRRVIRTSSGSTAEHEFAHHIQYADPDLDALFVAEHLRRTSGDKLQIVTRGTSETGRPDKYVDPYQGREYNGDPREVMSVAFEAVLGQDSDGRKRSDYWFAWMLKNDQEMLRLVLGALYHYTPGEDT